MAEIVLIGFMGVGKTTVGNLVAHKLGLECIDIDKCIENWSGQSVTTIFTEKGEDFFRRAESEFLADMLSKNRVVVSTGGGIVVNECNRVMLRQAANNGTLIVWLRADSETILGRISGDHTRPLLQTDDPHQTIEKLLQVRKPWYQAVAGLTLDCDGLSPQTCADLIIAHRTQF